MALVIEKSTCEEEVWQIPELLNRKSVGEELTEKQINYIVRSICDRTLDDCQLGALLMSVKLQGMTDEETITLTKAMRDSGAVMSWPQEWIVVDKHSTGGVGDKVSLPLAPALAANGLKVPMISGRGLEHTGGTLDKLESIPGFRVNLNKEEMMEALTEAGCYIAGQTVDVVPADRRMYSARDVTSTVTSTPLIVSSIISKKAASSPKALVLDVKYGRGAFMKTQEQAQNLAQKIVDVAKGIDVATSALLTTMDIPIGKTIGNSLEVKESIDCLHGKGPQDLQELVMHLGGELLLNAGVAKTAKEGREAILQSLLNGTARAKFSKMLQKQGVSLEVAESLCGQSRDYSSLPSAAHITNIVVDTAGVVADIDPMALAKVSLRLGAGRTRVGEPINYGVGIVLLKVVGDSVSAGEAWAQLHHDDDHIPEVLLHQAKGAITIAYASTEVPKSLISAKIV